MHNKHLYSPASLSLLLTALVSLVLMCCYVWSFTPDGHIRTIDGDGKDYYSYLITFFIDHNPGQQSLGEWYVVNTPTGTINVHSIGVSLLLLPFFGIACLLSHLFHFTMDGYSAPFQIMTGLAAFTYGILGLWGMLKTWRLFSFTEHTMAMAIPLLWFGTSILNYALHESAMSHAFAFCGLAWFIYFGIKTWRYGQSSFLWLFILSWAILVLIRPAHLLLLALIPFLAGDFHTLRHSWKNIINVSVRQKAIWVLAALPLSFQSIVWYIQNGKWIQDSYKGNGFYFSNPQFFKFLFGWDNGFFLYSPILLLVLPGIYLLIRKNKFEGLSLMLFLTGIVYFLSSYWAYTYYDGIGMRVMVDFIPLLSLPFLVAMQQWQQRKWVYLPLGLLCFHGLSIQYQYQEGIWPASGVTAKKFSYLYGKWGSQYRQQTGGANDLAPFAEGPIQCIHKLTSTEKAEETFEYRQGNEYGLTKHILSLGTNTNTLHFKITLERKLFEDSGLNKGLLAIHIKNDKEENKAFSACKLEEIPENPIQQWEKLQYAVTVKGRFTSEDKIDIFVWNIEKQHFAIKNLNVEIYNYPNTV